MLSLTPAWDTKKEIYLHQESLWNQAVWDSSISYIISFDKVGNLTRHNKENIWVLVNKINNLYKSTEI